MIVSYLIEQEIGIGSMEDSGGIWTFGIFSIYTIDQVIQQDGILWEYGSAVAGTVSQWQVEFLCWVQRALTVQALALVVVDQPEQDHLIHFIDVLINN